MEGQGNGDANDVKIMGMRMETRADDNYKDNGEHTMMIVNRLMITGTG